MYAGRDLGRLEPSLGVSSQNAAVGISLCTGPQRLFASQIRTNRRVRTAFGEQRRSH